MFYGSVAPYAGSGGGMLDVKSAYWMIGVDLVVGAVAEKEE